MTKIKKLLLLSIVIVLFTGCYNINNMSNDELVNFNIYDVGKPNTFLKGYKFYTPVGMTLLNDINSNNILYCDGEKYYLYVDIVSFYNKVDNNYDSGNSPYFFKKIEYDGKVGYVQINKLNDKYLLEIMYNYAKIEVVTNDIKKALSNSIIVLKSIMFNEKVVKTLIDDNSLNYDEESFKLLGPNVYTDNFLKYIEDYGTYEEDDLQDDDVIDLNSTD